MSVDAEMRSRRVLVTGPGGVLGRELASTFQAAGWTVFAAGRDAERRTPAAEGVAPVELDLSSDEQITAAACSFLEGVGEREAHVALVANASNRDALAPDWDQVDRVTFHALVDIDVIGHFMLAREIVQGVRERNLTASILFISSIYGLGGVRGSVYPEGMASAPLQYSTAKAALIGLTRDLAARVGPYGVLVNCLAAGGILGDQDPEFVNRYSELTQLGRMASASEIAGMAEVLCSARGSYVTGQVIPVDGGWTAW